MEKKIKVAVAMSGGVDSGVAAALLVEKGYEVIGLHLNFWKELREEVGGFLEKVGNRCCSLESLEAARRTAVKLEIPFYVKDYAEDFKKIVVDYFLAEYAAGRTPNPCVVCNQFIKFGKLLEYARALGCDYLATGHYARISSSTAPSGPRELHSGNPCAIINNRGANPNIPLADPSVADASSDIPTYHLLKGVDKFKDQSYFLWTLTQDKLAQILFPVGDRKKSEVKKLARVKNLPVSDRPESFEVCFILDNDYRDFLKRHIPEAIKPGEVVNTKGEIIGKHFGLPLYTIGQRKGFEVRSSVPLYVVGKNLEKNQLVVGRGKESERQKFTVGSVSWILGEGPEGLEGKEGVRCDVRIRHQGELLNAKVSSISAKTAEIVLDDPVRGITPGQSAVFYDGEEVLGGGVIEG